MLDYGITFLHTPIFIDNSSAISIVNNPVKHSKTKHIEIRYHFIRDCNEKKLIQVVNVHTDNQFDDLFTKAFDMGRFTFLCSLVKNPCVQMASMVFIDEHNEIAMLQKTKQAEGFYQIVDFLRSSHISHALTVSPTIYIEHQRQFWANATTSTENGVSYIKTRVCDKPLTVTEETIRICLRLDDASGISSIPNEDLFSNLTRMGYEGQMGIFKFFKAQFSPQWRFFVHTLMHCISKKTTGWRQFSSTIAYALVCLSTARKYNFSLMIFNDLVSNLDNKKSFFMYPRFVQAVITNELTDIPHFDEVYVPKPPKGKVFSNMRRSARDSEGVDTPLFSTMMVVSQPQEGMASGSRPSLDQPTESQTQPSLSQIFPQSFAAKPTPMISKTYVKRKVYKAPSLVVLTINQEPQSPLLEHSPIENVQRETTRVSPNPEEVLSKEMNEHMDEKAATTSASTEKDSGNISKTFTMATLGEKSTKGPWRQETKGVVGASARQKATTKRSKDLSRMGKTSKKGEDRTKTDELMAKGSNDPSRVGKTSKEGEDSYTYLELMETIANINVDVVNQRKEIKALQQVIISQQEQISKLKKLVGKLIAKKRRKQFVLRRREGANKKEEENDSKKGESSSSEKMDQQIEGENVEAKGEFVEERAEEKAEGVIETKIFAEAAKIGKAAVNKAEAAETTPVAVTTPAVETVTTAEPKGAAENIS
ncbi:hypothetical protein L6452_09967 [Arctium lappa]|uniref:Uncharacterized protein n=1 Tax=Arctium lappa TaxID=4217 RepID=A0ACB9DM07_ARCLA|nr:hypothetical protein L6452_09967 [Arctium lappa]